MNMRTENSKILMHNLFINYAALLRWHGIKWVIDSNPKFVVQHIISAIKPAYFRPRHKSDLSFAQHSLRRNYTGFMQHALKVSEAPQIVDPD